MERILTEKEQNHAVNTRRQRTLLYRLIRSDPPESNAFQPGQAVSLDLAYCALPTTEAGRESAKTIKTINNTCLDYIIENSCQSFSKYICSRELC
jgi:hypothetical protein